MSGITHNIFKNLRLLRQTFSQDKKPIGFFISAGCPLSVEMPEEDWPLIPDMKRLSDFVHEKLKSGDPKKPNKFDDLLCELELSEKKIDNLEDVLSFIRALKSVAHGGVVRGFKEEDLNKLETDICGIIVQKIKTSLPNKETPYHKLSKWINSIDRDSAIEIFTTNYDLLMEQALEEIGVPYFDGFVGSRQSFFDLRSVEDNLIPRHWTRLWKIHGSINWYQKKDKNEIFRSDAYRNEGSDTSYLIYPSHLKYDQSRKMPFLALSDQLNRFLKQPSAALVLCGYSFNDQHINDIIINALKSNPTAIVIAMMFGKMKNKENKDQYPKAVEIAIKRHNLCLWADDEAIIGTNRGAWERFNEEDKYIGRFVEDEEGNTIIKLGDFKIFADFLSSLIGHKEEDWIDGK